jgi:aminopeptidase C
LLDAQAFDWNLLLGENWAMPLLLPRSERLKFRQGAVTHAMVFVEYDQQTGSLYVENSWGPHNKKGYLHMTKDWFMEHVWQVEVLADVLPEQLVSLWRKKGSAHVRKLPRWDPLGVLLGGDNECCRESYGAKVEN